MILVQSLKEKKKNKA